MTLFDERGVVRNGSLLSGILWCLFLPHTAACQAGPTLPVPEFYGIYAVSNGQLIKLDGKEVRADKNAFVMMGQRQAVSGVLNGAPVASSQSAGVPVLSPDLKIVVYLQTVGMFSPLQAAETLHIEPLDLVRNETNLIKEKGKWKIWSVSVANGVQVVRHSAESEATLFGLFGAYKWQIKSPTADPVIVVKPSS